MLEWISKLHKFVEYSSLSFCHLLPLVMQKFSKQKSTYMGILPNTPETRYSKPRCSKILDIVKKTQLPFMGFYRNTLPWYSERLDIVNKRGLTGSFTISRLGCTMLFLNFPAEFLYFQNERMGQEILKNSKVFISIHV